VIKLRRSSEPYIGQKPQSEDTAVFVFFFYDYFCHSARYTSELIAQHRFSDTHFQTVVAIMKKCRKKNQQGVDHIQYLNNCFKNILSGGSWFIRNKQVCS
jgi:hypothetical protein